MPATYKAINKYKPYFFDSAEEWEDLIVAAEKERDREERKEEGRERERMRERERQRK